MTTRKNAGHQVAQLRTIIGKSQSQFAAMIGVSKHTVISVENGRNQVSRKLAQRIHEATGAVLEYGGFPTVADYTLDFFNWWRTKWFPSNEERARALFDELTDRLETVLLAAAKPGVAGNRDRLPAVCFSFREWIDETVEKSKLGDQIDEVLCEKTRRLEEIPYRISDLLKDTKKARELLAKHGIDFKSIKKQLQKYKRDGWLLIEDEFRDTWDPLPDTNKLVVEKRRLIPSPRCSITPSGDWFSKTDAIPLPIL